MKKIIGTVPDIAWCTIAPGTTLTYWNLSPCKKSALNAAEVGCALYGNIVCCKGGCTAMWQARASISVHNRPSPPPWGGGNWREPKLRWRGWQWGLRAQYVRASANNTFSPHNRLLHHLLLILVTGVFEAVTVQPGGWQRELEDEDDLYKKKEEEHFSLSRSCIIN